MTYGLKVFLAFKQQFKESHHIVWAISTWFFLILCQSLPSFHPQCTCCHVQCSCFLHLRKGYVNLILLDCWTIHVNSVKIGFPLGGKGVIKTTDHRPLTTNSKHSKHVLHFIIHENLYNYFHLWKLCEKFIRVQHVQFKFRRTQNHKESFIEAQWRLKKS